jgi:hypothetical protein
MQGNNSSSAKIFEPYRAKLARRQSASNDATTLRQQFALKYLAPTHFVLSMYADTLHIGEQIVFLYQHTTIQMFLVYAGYTRQV